MKRPPLAEVLKREPVFAVTSDLDWASEACIATMLDACGRYGIEPTLFVTHDSNVAQEAERRGAAKLNIHPNFLPGSTHGTGLHEVVATVRELVPHARGSRSHCFMSSSHIIRALVESGIRYDSSPLLIWQQDLVPLRHGSGLIHLPVFWEDDAHWEVETDWDFDRMRDRFLQPGLKIINIHPFFFALNIPSARFYLQHKALIQTVDQSDIPHLRYSGRGCADFAEDLLAMLKREALPCLSLDAIYRWHGDS